MHCTDPVPDSALPHCSLSRVLSIQIFILLLFSFPYPVRLDYRTVTEDFLRDNETGQENCEMRHYPSFSLVSIQH
jgi:hypothetical protein